MKVVVVVVVPAVANVLTYVCLARLWRPVRHNGDRQMILKYEGRGDRRWMFVDCR
jgi:hypothetical protein